MTGSSIAAEVAAGLSEAAIELSDGGFSIALVTPPSEAVKPTDDKTGTEVTQPLTGIVQMYSRKQIDGTLIQAGDRRVMIAAKGPVPTTNDRLLIGTDSYAIINVDELAPAGVALMYEVQARK